MKNFFMYSFLIIVLIFLSFLIFNYFNKDVQKIDNYKNFKETNFNKEKLNNKKNTEDISNFTENKINGKRSGNSEANLNKKTNLTGLYSESSCILVRPGNIPNIECSVNYITKEKVSLKIKNGFGENIGIIINLKTCSPEINDVLENNNEKDFIFSCNNDISFNQELSLEYILGENETIKIGGVVIGPVLIE